MPRSSRGIAYEIWPFEIELLLAADLERVGEAMRRGGDGGTGVAAREVHRRQHVALRRVRLDRRQDRRQRLDRERRLRLRGGTACLLARLGDHREHGLADVVDDAVGEDRIVVDDRAAVVRPGNVGGDQHRDDAGQRRDAGAVDRDQAPVGDGRKTERRVQRAGELGQVVDVRRRAGDVQVRRFVRQGSAHAGRERRAGARCRGAQPLRIERTVHGVASARAAGPTCAIELHTLESLAASGAFGRVSSQKRLSRFCATCRR